MRLYPMRMPDVEKQRRKANWRHSRRQHWEAHLEGRYILFISHFSTWTGLKAINNANNNECSPTLLTLSHFPMGTAT